MVSHRCKFHDPSVLMLSPYFVCYKHLSFLIKKMVQVAYKIKQLNFFFEHFCRKVSKSLS